MLKVRQPKGPGGEAEMPRHSRGKAEKGQNNRRHTTCGRIANHVARLGGQWGLAHLAKRDKGGGSRLCQLGRALACSQSRAVGQAPGESGA